MDSGTDPPTPVMNNQPSPEPRLPPRQGQYRRYEHPGRPHRIAPSFTDQELAEITAAARHSGLTLTGYCAQATLDAARNNHIYTSAEQAQLQTLARLQVELLRTRVALNQVRAQLAHAGTTANRRSTARPSLNKAITQAARSLSSLDGVVGRIDEQLDS